jgi:hypothetical protein
MGNLVGFLIRRNGHRFPVVAHANRERHEVCKDNERSLGQKGRRDCQTVVSMISGHQGHHVRLSIHPIAKGHHEGMKAKLTSFIGDGRGYWHDETLTIGTPFVLDGLAMTPRQCRV